MMNTTNSSSSSLNALTFPCFRSELSEDEYLVADFFFSVLAIVLNLLTCPPTILLNALIIIVVKTKRRLQTSYNILLASLAGTDLAVGLAAQPVFVIKEIYRLSTGSPYVYCKINSPTEAAAISLCLASLIHLALISVERLVAMKYSLRYESIFNNSRLAVAVAASWLIAMNYFISRLVPDIPVVPAHIYASLSLLVIFYCHISVYFVCRRHIKQIKSEQVSAEARAKFLAERKAWKTTSILVGCVFMSFAPALLRTVIAFPNSRSSFIWRMAASCYPLTFSCFMFNSLLNPIIYCWRREEIRQALKQVVT